MNKYKISEEEIAANNVKSAADHITDKDVQKTKNIFDRLPELIAHKFNGFVDWVKTELDNRYTKTATDERITERIKQTGGGNMLSEEYAVEGEVGVVKTAANARQLDGKNADYFMAKANFEFDEATQTLNITL